MDRDDFSTGGATAQPELAGRASAGTRAMLATRFLALIVTALSITVLPRLIAPADFGLWAVAGLAVGLATILREFGLLPTIVQAPSISRRQQDGFYWTSVIVSLLAAGLLASAAPLLARLYDAPVLAPVIWVCCASLVLSGFGLVHVALLRRELVYGRVALIEGGAMVCGLAVGVVCAVVWRDVWALVAGHLASAAWTVATAYACNRWLPGRPGRDAGPVSFAFSAQLTAYNLLTHLANNVGIAAGYRFGAAQIGFFNRAQHVYLLAHFALLTPLTEVAFSLLCRLKSEAAYRDAYLQLARRVWVLFIPYAAVLPLIANDVVLALLGTNWASAGPILAWFAPAVAGQAFATLVAQVLTSQGRGRELRLWAVADLFLRGGGALVGSQFGIVGVAAGFSAGSLAGVPIMAWLVARRGPVRVREQLAALRTALPIGAVAAGTALLASWMADGAGASAGWERLLVVGTSVALAWGTVCLALRSAREALLGTRTRHA